MKSSPFSLSKRKSSGVFYVRFRLPNKKWGNPKSTGCHKKRDAMVWCEERLRSVGQPLRKEGMSFREFAEGFFDEDGPWDRSTTDHSRRVRRTHLKNQQARLSNYLIPTFGEWRLDEFSPGDVDRALLHLRDTAQPKHQTRTGQLSNRTVNTLRSALKAIFDDAVRQGFLSRSPIDKVPRLSERPQKRGTLTKDEIKLLGDPKSIERIWGHPRYWVMFQIAITTGARSAEIRSLHTDDVAKDYLAIRRSLDDVQGETEDTKTGLTRTVPISPRLNRNIRQWMKLSKAQPGAYLFPSPVNPDRPIDRDYTLKNFRRALENIGIDRDRQEQRGLVYHSLRHVAAALAVASGINPWLVRQMTGHRSDAVFENYLSHSELADWGSLMEWQSGLLEYSE